MAFSFKVGPPVLSLIWSGTGSGAGTVTGARTQCHSMSGTGKGADIGPGLRARARADATPGTRARVWAGKSRIGDEMAFADVILKRLSVFDRVRADLRITDRILFHSVGTQSRLDIRSARNNLSSLCSVQPLPFISSVAFVSSVDFIHLFSADIALTCQSTISFVSVHLVWYFGFRGPGLVLLCNGRILPLL